MLIQRSHILYNVFVLGMVAGLIYTMCTNNDSHIRDVRHSNELVSLNVHRCCSILWNNIIHVICECYRTNITKLLLSWEWYLTWYTQQEHWRCDQICYTECWGQRLQMCAYIARRDNMTWEEYGVHDNDKLYPIYTVQTSFVLPQRKSAEWNEVMLVKTQNSQGTTVTDRSIFREMVLA